MITKIVPYLYFEGNAEEAMAFYSEIFECDDSDIMRYKEMKSNAETREELAEKIIHGSLKHKNFELYFSDTFEEAKLTKGAQMSLTIEFDSEEEIRRVFDALKEGGKVTMELQETFWEAIYGSVTDKYGMNWELNHQIVRL